MVAGLGLSDAMDDESVQRWTVATDGTGTSLVAAAITATTSLASSTLLATTTSQPSAGPSTTITNSQDTLPKSTDVWSEQTTRGQSGNSTDTQGSQALQNPNMVVPIGMIVGGISGGLVLLIMALGMYWWYLRHMRTRGTRELDMLESAADSRRRPGVSSPHHVITPYPVPRQDPATIPLAIIPPHRHKPSLASASSSSTFTPGHYYAGSQSSAFTASPTSKFGTMSDGYMWSPVSEQNRQIRPSLILEQQNLIIEQLQMLKEQVALQSRSRSASASADLHSSSPSLSRTSTLPPPRYS
ncbi:hypothetical protein FRC03_011135 [Tulasnella sp. 419]|nr:hypothetical protein FRC03_011135 [Tulasnella sp. 419]